jgi:hypothetical protein
MKKRALYYYSKDTLTFAEAKWAKFKIAVITVLLSVAVIAILIETNQKFDDVLGLGIHRANFLTAENVLLKNEIRLFSSKLHRLENQLMTLSDRNEEMRLMVDLPKLDEDVRSVGIGGTEERVFVVGDREISHQIQSIASFLSKAERELNLQRASYSASMQKYEENTVKFAHLPAIKPMEGFLSSRFGMRFHPIFHINRQHPGIDIVNQAGTPIYASGNGKVVASGRNLGGYGIMVMLDHGFGYTTLYGHLEKTSVREGQTVRRGDIIGRCGRTGIATNAHLHYEVRLNGIQQNPIDYFFNDLNYHAYANIQPLDESN